MAIQPIDLQALFTQLDKVAKNQTLLRDGQPIQESLQQLQVQRKLEENVQSVNETQDMGEGAEKVKEDGSRGTHARQGKGQSEEEPPAAEEDKPDYIRDPALGRNIDISG